MDKIGNYSLLYISIIDNLNLLLHKIVQKPTFGGLLFNGTLTMVASKVVFMMVVSLTVQSAMMSQAQASK